MSPIAVRSFRLTPTTYYLNGPSLSYGANQPSNLTISNSGIATFVGITSLVYPATFPVPPVGLVTYRWYDQFGPIIDSERNNGGDLGITTFVGAATTTLTISNVINPTDNSKQYYLVSYFTPQNSVGFNTFANAFNSPLQSNNAILTVKPYLTIITQPTSVTGVIENTSTFNVSVNVSDSTTGSITYQWRVNGSNLSDGTSGDRIVSGSTTSSLNIRITTTGTYTIDCVVSHPNTDPGSVTSTSATFLVQDNVRILTHENMSIGSPGDWMGFSGGTRHNVSTGTLRINYENQRLHYIYAPDRDVDAIITMAAPAARSGGQGGWMTFRYTFLKGVEHALIIHSRESGGEPRRASSGGSLATQIRGEKGAGGIYLYRLNELIAVCGGGGGNSDGGAGGDGSGANIPNGARRGQNGTGTNSGLGGDGGPSNDSYGLVGAADKDNYWPSGTVTDADALYNTITNTPFLNNPDSPPNGLFGPGYDFGGQFKILDYRSSRPEASRGSRAFNNSRGVTGWINDGLRENTNDCYRVVGIITDTDGDTRNNRCTLSAMDIAAGRRSNIGNSLSPYFSSSAGNDSFYNRPGNVFDPNFPIPPEPNIYWNKIGEGSGQTRGIRINFSGIRIRTENVGGSDDFNSTQDGRTRRTKAVNRKFERDNPDNYAFKSDNSGEIIRGFRYGFGARVNGGWSKFGGAGGGNGAAGGGSGAGYPHWSGGGGGSGWADGKCTVLKSVTGGNIGEGYLEIKAVNPNQTIESQLPSEPISPNPTWRSLDWDDTRNFGWKRSSDGERWPIESATASSTPSFSTGSCSNANGTFLQAPLVRLVNNNDIIKSQSQVRLKGGLDEQTDNLHTRFYGGCKINSSTGSAANSVVSGNLYFTNSNTNGGPDDLGNRLYTPLRYDARTGLEQVAWINFYLELPDFSAAKFETAKGSQVYLNDSSVAPNSYEFNQQSTYGYTDSNPPSKYLRNHNSVRARYNPFTDKWTGGKPGSGSQPYKSSDRWTSDPRQAYIPFDATFEMVLEFDGLLLHTDRSAAPSDIDNRYRRWVITKTYEFRDPWQSRTIVFRSNDMWGIIGRSDEGSRFYLPDASIYNYRNPRITSWRVTSIVDRDTGGVNTLTLYPVLRRMRPDERPYVKVEVGRGIFSA